VRRSGTSNRCFGDSPFSTLRPVNSQQKRCKVRQLGLVPLPHYKDGIAIHVLGSGGGYLYYKEREYGINLECRASPSYEWRIRGHRAGRLGRVGQELRSKMRSGTTILFMPNGITGSISAGTQTSSMPRMP
jgi:hypothetical protein